MAKTPSGKKIMTLALLIIRLTISAVFIYASIPKIINPQEFGKQVAAYELLPLSLVYPFSFSLPFLELVCGILIWVPFTRISANLLNTLMMMLFLIAISYALILGKDINCGCFGKEDPIGIGKLLIDAALLLIIIYCLWCDRLKEKSLMMNLNKT